MDSRTYSVQQIFQDRRQYKVPFYQRSYVWNKRDQWKPLWEDIQNKADARLNKEKQHPHFIGAVVLEPQKKSGLMGVEQFHIIDGQQRLTTLQYVLVALSHILLEFDQKNIFSAISNCLKNFNPETMEDKEIERFKVWPTFSDQDNYSKAMTAQSQSELSERFPDSFTKQGELKKIGKEHPKALEAIIFFFSEMKAWIALNEFEADIYQQCEALAEAILTDLSIVGITLNEEDDAQIIFETLNGRGAELHAADLIRNFIFMKVQKNAITLYEKSWKQFELEIWKENQSRGRLNRPRLEWFVQSAIHAETGEEVEIGRLYAGYKKCIDSKLTLKSAEGQLEFLNRYAEHYLQLVTGVGNSVTALFGKNISAWDASSAHSIILRVATSNITQEEQKKIFDCVESYLVRRAVCGLPKKNYNKVFSHLLKKLPEQNCSSALFLKSLSELKGDASRWPTDEEFRHHWLEGQMYERLDATKIRSLFYRLELAMRSAKSEETIVHLTDKIDIDHILPASWSEHWPLNDGTFVDEKEIESVNLFAGLDLDDTRSAAILKRQNHLSRIGNLTLVHYGVNRSLQNCAFDKKRKALFEHSNLHLNRSLMQQNEWNESTIQKRCEDLFKVARTIWCSSELTSFK